MLISAISLVHFTVNSLFKRSEGFLRQSIFMEKFTEINSFIFTFYLLYFVNTVGQTYIRHQPISFLLLSKPIPVSLNLYRCETKDSIGMFACNLGVLIL